MDAGPYRDGVLRVAGFRGHEALSRPYRWDVLVDLEDVDFDGLEVDLMAQAASLEYTHDSEVPRVVHGVVSALRRVEASGDGFRRRLKLRLVPRLALLSRNRVSRIFQEMTVPEIVAEVLGDAGVPVVQRLQRRYSPRVYCVQYQESDLAFVARILAEEGIFYYFLQPPAMLSDLSAATAAQAFLTAAGVREALLAEVVVLADHAAAYVPIASRHAPVALRAPTLAFHLEEGGVPDEHHVARFARERVAKPQAVLLRDYDFRNPRAELAAAETTRGVPPQSTRDDQLRSFADVLGERLRRVHRGDGLDAAAEVAVDPRLATVYEHHGEDEDPEVTRAAARTRFEQVRRAVTAAAGASWCRRLTAGHRFRLDGHSDATLDGEYVLTEVHHIGRTGSHSAEPRRSAAYQNSFVCVPAQVPFRPAPAPRVHRQVLETATVVGPPNEEIYTDNHGRIKVQFHWDLAASGDERSSCWLRVNQAWAGANWGAQFIPRVGMEVIVSFLGGDQDRPVVLGCLYNGENTPTFSVPGDRTRSGFRTQSSPGGGGFNELSFEDAKGGEQVYLHAQKNLDEVVRNDRSARVGRDESIAVDRHQTTHVMGNRTEHVAGIHEETIESDRRVKVRGKQVHVSEKSDERWVQGDMQWRVDGRTRHKHTANVQEVYIDDHTVRVKGCQTTLVGEANALRHHSVHVEGTAAHFSSSGTEIRSDKELLLRCGKSSILLTPESIELSSPNVIMHSDFTQLTMDAKKIKLRAVDQVEVRGDATATILGATIQITTPTALKDEAKDPKVTTISLADTAGQALGHQRFRLTLNDGTVRTGFLDKDGRVEFSGELSGEIEFPDVGEVS